MCRAIVAPGMIRPNLMAVQIISELKMKCVHAKCDWTGVMDQMQMHLSKCVYGKGKKRPSWLSRQNVESK